MSPDLRVRELVAAGITTDSIIDGAGVTHDQALADLADVRTDSEITGVINDDADHGSRTAGVGASHDYWDALQTVATINDEDELTVNITGDADMVDGLHGRDLAEVGHNHDSRYLNDANDTVAESNLNFDPFTYSEYLQTLGEVVTSSDETLTGGTDPALKITLQEVTPVSDANLDVEVRVPSQPGFAADYGYSTEFEQIWDDSASAWDVEITVSWGVNPGSGNDVPVTVDVIERGDRTDPLPAGSNPNDHTNPTYDSDEDGTIDAPIDSPSVHAGELFIGHRSSEVPDSEIDTGETVFYVRDDGILYKKQSGGTETQVGGSGSGTDSRVNVSEDGAQVLANATDLNFTEANAATVSVTDDGDGSVSIEVSATDTDTQLDPTSLQSGGANELSVTGLSGDLADAQDPKTHDNGAHSTAYSSEGHDHSGETINPDTLAGIADTIVRSTSELESAFNNLAYGETVYIAQPATPYRPSQWLDIDVDGVTVIAQNQFAEDGQPCIKVADNANVGGIRVGNSTAVSDVEIRGVGVHGNDTNQDQTVIHLHGIFLVNAADSRVEQCFATRTSPYHVHNDGGSGIAAAHNCDRITIADNWTDDVGDRGIQTAATNVSVIGNYLSNGFDRSIALDMEEGAAGDSYGGSNTIVTGNVCYNNSEGSFIGLSGGGSNSPQENISIAENVGYDTHRTLVRIRPGASGVVRRNITIDGNVSTDGTGHAIATNTGGGEIQNLTVSNNQLSRCGGRGISIESGATGVVISGNAVKDPGSDGIRSAASDTSITGNYVVGASAHGLGCAAGGQTVTGNHVKNAGKNGITVDLGMSNLAIASNIINGTGKHGVGFAGESQYCIVGFNNIRGQTNAGIKRAGDYTTYIGNVLTNFTGTIGTNSKDVGNIIR
ncbi:right-handed parallel beta-helix repeat-containing protein [Halococcus saccharolyticus]|uniref:right-handed parallel beta-helix repeat-containing protein n=1 Tax=Halococcus saccharolyticus TaxID=62319 RepID=UPI00137639CE|nr:right-handed parallel beta-helix repeat-containing protein [Halococcus saccharolyticus]